jgi:ComF family protein
VIEYKFEGRRGLCEPLGEMLVRRFRNEYARPHRLPFDEVAAVVPVSLHPARRKWRGFDQADLLAQEVARGCEKPLWEDVLERVKNTHPLVDMGPRERAEEMHEAFAAHKPWKLAGASLLLVDDVYTTGATMMAAARALRQGGAKRVYGLTIARALPEWYILPPGRQSGSQSLQ